MTICIITVFQDDQTSMREDLFSFQFGDGIGLQWILGSHMIPSSLLVPSMPDRSSIICVKCSGGVIQKQVSIPAPGMSNARPRCQRFLHCCAADRLARSQSSASSVLISHGQRSRIENQIIFLACYPIMGERIGFYAQPPVRNRWLKFTILFSITLFYLNFISNLYRFHKLSKTES